MAIGTSKTWFVVYNNPCEVITWKTDSNGDYVRDKNNDRLIDSTTPTEYAGLGPQEICRKVLSKWCDQSETRTGACAYCISAKGLHHLHMVLEDVKDHRFTAVKKTYPTAHIEPTRGSKKQAEDYINKVGSWAEKGEQVLHIEYFGEIQGCQGKRSDLEEVEKLINEGMKPNEILKSNVKMYRQEQYINRIYFEKRKEETPLERTVETFYHVGLSGSGKSHSFVELCYEYGRDEVFLVSDYGNGFLDGYIGQRILFLDEFRGQIPYSLLLTMTNGYLTKYHARYNNIWGLWEQVHITSVLPPEKLYSRMVSENTDLDGIEQLLRRISAVVYHWKDEKGYHAFKQSREEYNNYALLIASALGRKTTNDFMQLTDKEAEQIQLIFG